MRQRRFVGFIFVCAFVLINLYVGIIFGQFTRIRLASSTSNAFLTKEQSEWVKLYKLVKR